MKAKEILGLIKANLPGVIRNTPYSAAVVFLLGMALGAWWF